jgi:phage terminase large subunit-like protein
MKQTDPSEASDLAILLAKTVGADLAKEAVVTFCQQFSPTELAALAAYWRFWARSKQLAPGGSWRSFGFLCGRSFGKTRAIAEHITVEIQQGRIGRLLLIAQNEDSALKIQIEGDSGLLTVAPPWFRPEWVPSKHQVIWPNGATANVVSPEVPGNIRGPQYHAAWATEFQSWGQATMTEAYDNVMLSTRLGYARLLWDATPKRGHPILKERLAMSELDPDKHIVRRGSSRENVANLAQGYVDDMETKMSGTARGREELLGEMLDDDDSAMIKQEWITRNRRAMPDKFKRKAIGVDPAITERKGSDRTGIVMAGLDSADHAYVLADRTGKYGPEKWGRIVLALYVEHRCSVVVVETNKGGDLVIRNLRASAREMGLEVILLGKNEPTPEHRKGVVFIREIYSRGAKEDRAAPLATAYESNRISHAMSVDLSELESTITGWTPEPGARSPDDLDALVHVMTELLGFADDRSDPSKAFVGIKEMSKMLQSHQVPQAAIARLLGHLPRRGL